MVNFPPQVTSSRSFLHLGNGFFAYLLSGMPLPSRNNLEHDDKERVLSILIFQAFPGTCMEDHTQAKFLYSVHYKINSAFSNQGGILGCFSVGPDVLPPWTKEAMALDLQSKEDVYAEATTQSLHPNSVEAEGDKDVQSIVVATTSVEATQADDVVHDDNTNTEDDFSMTAGSRLR
ncbi:hypothetical protein SO802_016584 [Lithocarpus litseifolius]|uniref:Uncharacterized protein n=1 Tax=Lithocarpus litseifolius TaxID=425828 RepID=A0AAW2CZ52_9ROSI